MNIICILLFTKLYLESTFMDGLYEYFGLQGFKQIEIKSLYNILNSEEFDSECLEFDIFENKNNYKQSNIILIYGNNKQFNTIYEYIYQTKCMFIIYIL